jgi:hypothetical protein
MKLTWDRVSATAELQTLYEETGERHCRPVAIAAGRDPSFILRRELLEEARQWVAVFPNAKLEFFDLRIARKIVQRGVVPSTLKAMYVRTYASGPRPLEQAAAKVRARVNGAMAHAKVGAGSVADLAGVPASRIARLLSGARLPLQELWSIDRAARHLGGDFTPAPPVAVGS